MSLLSFYLFIFYSGNCASLGQLYKPQPCLIISVKIAFITHTTILSLDFAKLIHISAICSVCAFVDPFMFMGAVLVLLVPVLLVQQYIGNSASVPKHDIQ